MTTLKKSFECLKRVRASTWVRLAVLVVALANAALRMCSHETVSLGNETAENVVSAVVLVVSALNGYWKNNSFTEAAQTADEILRTIKETQK